MAVTKKRKPVDKRRVASRRVVKVSAWGNCLGMRISKELATAMGLREGTDVSLEVRAGALVVTPVRKKWTESELLAGVTPAKVGGEVNWGPAVGKEVW